MRADRRMDRHDEANSRFSQFWEWGWKLTLFFYTCKTWLLLTLRERQALNLSECVDRKLKALIWRQVRTDWCSSHAILISIISIIKLSFNQKNYGKLEELWIDGRIVVIYSHKEGNWCGSTGFRNYT
jgi:hypothetical protein